MVDFFISNKISLFYVKFYTKILESINHKFIINHPTEILLKIISKIAYYGCFKIILHIKYFLNHNVYIISICEKA